MTGTVLDKVGALFQKFGEETAANIGIHPSDQAHMTSGPTHQQELSDIAEPTPHRGKRVRSVMEQERKIALKPGVGDTMRAAEVKANRRSGSVLGAAFSRMGAAVKPPGAAQIHQQIAGMARQFSGGTPYVSGTMLPANFEAVSIPSIERIREGSSIASPAPMAGSLTGARS